MFLLNNENNRMQMTSNVVSGQEIRNPCLAERATRSPEEASESIPGEERHKRAAAEKGNSYYAYARPEVQAMVDPNAKTILDIGCASGALGAQLKQKLKADVWGIEVAEHAAREAEHKLDRVITRSVEEALPDLPDHYFDTVIFADVLEHLPDPSATLERIRMKLSPGGEIIASIPNVRHWSVVRDLLEGRWDYADAGILDRTHLRFFTKKSIVELFQKAGFTIEQMEATVLKGQDIPETLVKALGTTNIDISTLREESNHYQYLVRAKLREAKKEGVVSIVILTRNELSYTRECVASIERHTPQPHEIVFVDNGSQDGTSKWLKEIVGKNRTCRLVENEHNLGFSKGCNQGIGACSGEYILLLNNDVVVTAEWLSGMLECLNSSDDIGIVGPMTNSVSGIQKVPSAAYESIEALSDYADMFRHEHRHRRIPLRRIVGFCMLFRRTLVDRIGLLDESFGTGNFEDDDYCLRSAVAGFRNMVAGDVFIHHYGSRSFIGNKVSYADLMGGNKRVFDAKWQTTVAPSPLGKEIAVLTTMEVADEYYRRQELDQAILRLIEGIKHSSESKAIYYRLAEILIAARSFPKAMEALDSMPEVVKDEAKWSVTAGRVKFGLEAYDESETYANQALLASPHYAPALNLKGLLAYNNNDIEMAKSYFEQAMQADPGYGEPYSYLGLLQWSTEDKRKAMDILEKAFVLSPEMTDVIHFYHSAIIQIGKFERAEQLVKENRELYPSNRELSLLLIDILIRQDKYAAAMEEIGQVETLYGIDDNLLAATQCIRDKAIRRKETGKIRNVNTSQGKLVVQDGHYVWQTRTTGLTGNLHKRDDGAPIDIVTNSEDPVSWGSQGTSSSVNKEQSSEKSRIEGLSSIIISVPSDPGRLNDCVNSIKRWTSGPLEILFALPPGSEKARHIAKAMKKANKRYGCTSFEDKSSLLGAINLTIEASSGEFIVLLDGNLQVTDGWLGGMLDCMKFVPNAALVGPLTNSAAAPQLLEATGCRTSSEWDAFAKAFRHRNFHRRAIAMKVAGFCMLFKGDLVGSIGLLDQSLENTSLWNVDFCLRAFLSGYRSVIAGDVFVRNYADQSGERNPNIFSAKWNSSDPGSDTGKALIALKAMEYAQGFLGLDKTEEAVKALMEGIKATPDDVRLYHYLARLLLDAKAPGEALAALQSIPETSRHDTETLELLSYASAALEQDEEADKLAEELLSINGCNATALNVKGLLAFRKSEIDRAITYFRDAMESDPGYAEPYRNLGLIEWSLDDMTKAFDLFEKAFILAPESENNATTYYASVTEMEAWGRSEQVLLDAKALYPSNRRIAFLLIDVLLKQGRLESAIGRIEEAMTTFCVDDGLLRAALEVREKLGPLRIAANSGMGTLSVCMITKDEEVNIARCLRSLRPIADEIIIVDTGSTDRTKAIARVFGAQVFDYVWRDDFSAARNASLEKAKGDWILVHDADEVISPLDYEELHAITCRKPLKPVGYSLVTRNYTTSITLEGWTANLGDYPEETCAGWFPSCKVRIFVNDARFRFRNPVHELLEPALRENGVEIKVCRIPIHHYGRLNEVKTSAKAEVYYELGRTKLQIAKDNPAALRELAVQAIELGKDDEAIDLWRRYIELDPNLPMAHYSLSHCHLKNDEFENALTSAMRAFELDPTSSDAALQYATALFFSEKSRDAIPLIEDVLKRAPNHFHAQITLAVALILDGQEKSRGVDLLAEMKKMNCDCSQLICTLAEKLKAAGKSDRVSRVLSSAMEAGYSHPDWPGLLEGYQLGGLNPPREGEGRIAPDHRMG